MSVSLHPYKYIISDGRYYFKTESGIEYFAYFLDLSDYWPGFYTFNFEKLDTADVLDKTPPGRFVLDTICLILLDFFRRETNAVLFVCDSTDGRAEGRHRLFARKFDAVNNGSFEKVDRYGKTIYYSVYSSLIFRKDNPDKDGLLDAFNRICADSLIVE